MEDLKCTIFSSKARKTGRMTIVTLSQFMEQSTGEIQCAAEYRQLSVGTDKGRCKGLIRDYSVD